MLRATLRIAQTGSVLANFDENLDHHCSIVEDAIRAGKDAVIFPELSLSGYNVQDAAQDIAMHIRDDKLEPLRLLSKKICIICGGIELSDDYGVYNSAFMFEDGEGKSIHRKLYLPTYGMFEELRYFSAGGHVRTVDSKRLGRIGVAICEDFWHVSVPYLLAHQGAKMLIALMSSPPHRAGRHAYSCGPALQGRTARCNRGFLGGQTNPTALVAFPRRRHQAFRLGTSPHHQRKKTILMTMSAGPLKSPDSSDSI